MEKTKGSCWIISVHKSLALLPRQADFIVVHGQVLNNQRKKKNKPYGLMQKSLFRMLNN